jgi:hypothetical protein
MKFIGMKRLAITNLQNDPFFLLSIGNWEFYIENCLDRGYRLGVASQAASEVASEVGSQVA